ncbi:MAG: MGMT family protein [Muricomes sp.]
MDFYKRVALVCRQIPEGKVATYGQIALLCGKPKNARQVGFALNRGLTGDVPAYRIVNSKGILSGAASFATSDLQKQMLEKEKVQVLWTEDGWRVNLKNDGWKNSMEDALWLRNEFEVQGI